MITKLYIKGEKPKYGYNYIPEYWPLKNNIIGKLLWKIFGNSDDPEPPNWYLPNEDPKKRLIKWYIRNPFHNFAFYIIGFNDHDRICIGKNPGVVLKDGLCCYISIILPYRFIVVPFISYQKRLKNKKVLQFYIGWRRGGAFGFKFRIV